MGNFKHGGNRFGGGGRRDERGPRLEMHSAICDECGKHCEVPFKPSSGKPIFCSDCFSNREGGSESRSFERRDSGRDSRRDSGRDFNEKRMFPAVCDECGDSCEVPFKPSSDKPIYCSHCFGKSERDTKRSGDSRPSSIDNKQIEILNTKIDKILTILNATLAPKIKEVKAELVKVEETIKEVKKEKTTAKAKVEKKETAKPKKEVKEKKVAVKKVKAVAKKKK